MPTISLRTSLANIPPLSPLKRHVFEPHHTRHHRYCSMDYNSVEEPDVSVSKIDEYVGNPNQGLKAGISKAKVNESQNDTVVLNMADRIVKTNEILGELEHMFDEKTLSLLHRIHHEKDGLHSNFLQETRKLLRQAREHVRGISEEQEKREALTERRRQKLDEEKQKREKEEALRNILQLEKQKLEMEIQEINEELQQKVEDLSAQEELIDVLVIKERQSNGELQEARKTLIKGMSDTLGRYTRIGLKRMGEIDERTFHNTCKAKFPAEEAMLQAATLCWLWRLTVNDLQWYPFKVITSDGISKQILDEGNEKLQNLKRVWGGEAYDAVVTALKELDEYNPSRRYAIRELWNFKKQRKATLTEAIEYLFKKVKTHKRKRNRH